MIGTKLLHGLPHRTLGRLFLALLIVSAVRLFFESDIDLRPAVAGVRGVVAVDPKTLLAST